MVSRGCQTKGRTPLEQSRDQCENRERILANKRGGGEDTLTSGRGESRQGKIWEKPGIGEKRELARGGGWNLGIPSDRRTEGSKA